MRVRRSRMGVCRENIYPSGSASVPPPGRPRLRRAPYHKKTRYKTRGSFSGLCSGSYTGGRVFLGCIYKDVFFCFCPAVYIGIHPFFSPYWYIYPYISAFLCLYIRICFFFFSCLYISVLCLRRIRYGQDSVFFYFSFFSVFIYICREDDLYLYSDLYRHPLFSLYLFPYPDISFYPYWFLYRDPLSFPYLYIERYFLCFYSAPAGLFHGISSFSSLFFLFSIFCPPLYIASFKWPFCTELSPFLSFFLPLSRILSPSLYILPHPRFIIRFYIYRPSDSRSFLFFYLFSFYFCRTLYIAAYIPFFAPPVTSFH